MPHRSDCVDDLAPKATEVKLSGGDIPGSNSIEFKKQENGVWEAKTAPVVPGAYRYSFNIDGVNVNDPRNSAVSESNANTASLVYVPGSDLWDTKDVPHGSVSEVFYSSKTLGKTRRAHIYLPPGYEKGSTSYPVFYLLHGAFDCDDSWTSVGRAGFIMDNLIATGKAKPMIVVMPAGHTAAFRFGPGDDFEKQMKDFEGDFNTDLRPMIEANYRTIADREHRAIAGLSMGGAQALNVSFSNLKDYAYVGVFSSGIFGITGGPGGGGPSTQWEDSHKETLDDVSLKKGLKLVWFGTGTEDFLVQTTQATVDMLKKHEFNVTYRETDGGHTWLKWRDYLAEFAPQLFQ